jgi:hypothetical protein
MDYYVQQHPNEHVFPSNATDVPTRMYKEDMMNMAAIFPLTMDTSCNISFARKEIAVWIPKRDIKAYVNFVAVQSMRFFGTMNVFDTISSSTENKRYNPTYVLNGIKHSINIYALETK